jgi:hypothetical protein
MGLTITDGRAGDGNGGGIWVRSGAALRLSDAAVVGNDGWDGAGIYSEGTIDIARSTVSGNHADDNGAGLYLLGGDASLENTTISANVAVGNGGGAFVGTNLDLTNVTIADNEAESGGGIHEQVDTQTTDSTNTIVVRNLGGSCSGTTGAIVSTFTLTDDASCIPGGDPSNLLVTDPRLGSLGDNGGPTQTLLPLDGSDAIDNGSSAACPAVDQRGEPRPAGAGCDIGAVEVQPQPAHLTVITQVQNDRGGVWIPQDFTTRVGDETTARSGSETGVEYTLPPGAYTVSEDPARGYVSSIGGDCASNGTITLASQESKTCTITNSDVPMPDNGLVLESYGPSRTDGDWGLTESLLSQTRGYLRDPAAFGPSGTVRRAYDIAPGIREANERTLAGVDVFFTGWVSSFSYTPDEKPALLDFVRAGGTLIATTDDTGHSMVDAFGLTQGDGSGSPTENVITAPDHAIASGAFGTVSTYRQYDATGHYTLLGPDAHEIGRYASGPGTTLAVIERGRLGPGSGAAIFVADVDVFTDHGGAGPNATLIKNIFAFAAGEGARPSVTVNDVGTAEGDTGTTAVAFTVRLSIASPSAVRVHYATANDTAAAPGDYAATVGDLEFSPGQTSKQVVVAVRGDTTVEGDERFRLNLSSPVGARIADSQGLATIVNDDRPLAPLEPKPKVHKSVVAAPSSGTVKVKVAGSNKFVALTGGQEIPLGTVVDTKHGRVTIVAASNASGGTATAGFYDGIFKLGQTKGKKPITVLTLVEKLSCKASGGKASAAAKKKRKRRLWGDGNGRFRTSGKHSAATVVGTKWLVEDTCTTTLTRVARGTVSVRDFAKKKTVVVKAGKKYIARAA